MVSPKPLSVFVPDVTLIAFPVPGFPNSRRETPRGGRTFSSRDELFAFRVKNMVLILIVGTNSGANPNSPWLDPCGVLDGCSQPRNQRPHQNCLIL
jgi:hypothetical protein